MQARTAGRAQGRVRGLTGGRAVRQAYVQTDEPESVAEHARLGAQGWTSVHADPSLRRHNPPPTSTQTSVDAHGASFPTVHACSQSARSGEQTVPGSHASGPVQAVA